MILFFIIAWAWSAARADRVTGSDEGLTVALRGVVPTAFARSLVLCVVLSLALYHGFGMVPMLMIESLMGALVVIAIQTVHDVRRAAA
ncbi:MAG TPA: hypothetical protein VGM93_04210 [Acidimicrobiales bacterium]